MGMNHALRARVEELQQELERCPPDLAVKLVASEIALHDVRCGTRRAKRVFDIVGSLAGLIVCAPILVVLVLLIRLDSRDGAIFAQTRIGRGGDPFRIYKLRSLYSSSPRYCDKPEVPWAARVTRVGRFLRRTSLDEIPQLWNVLRGDMSLVGPRPEMPHIVREYTLLNRMRLAAKPGLTGLWQISGFRGERIHAHIEYDLFYVTQCSLRLDAQILLGTLGAVVDGRGAR